MTTIKWWVGFPPGSMHAARLPAQFITNTVTSVCISWARSRGPVSKVSPCTMELPEYALKGLQLLADPSHFSDKTFHILVEAAFESLLNPQTDGATLGKRECCSSLRGRGREDEGLGFFPTDVWVAGRTRLGCSSANGSLSQCSRMQLQIKIWRHSLFTNRVVLTAALFLSSWRVVHVEPGRFHCCELISWGLIHQDWGPNWTVFCFN